MRETNKKQTATATATTTTPITTTPTTTIDKPEAVVEAVADIKKAKEEAKMTTRPRRDSTSSLAAATQLKAQKDGSIGRTEINTSSSNSSSSSNIHHNQVSSNKKPIVRMDRNKEVEKEATKYAASNSPPKNTPTTAHTKPPRIPPQPDPELGTTSKIEDNNRYT